MARAKCLALAFLLLSGLPSVAQTQLAAKPTAKNGPKLGLMIADLRHERWQTDVEQFTIRAGELDSAVLTRDGQSNADLQLDQAKELISKGVKVLVVNPVDGDKAAELVAYAHKHGVPVVCYDRMILRAQLVLLSEEPQAGTDISVHVSPAVAVPIDRPDVDPNAGQNIPDDQLAPVVVGFQRPVVPRHLPAGDAGVGGRSDGDQKPSRHHSEDCTHSADAALSGTQNHRTISPLREVMNRPACSASRFRIDSGS